MRVKCRGWSASLLMLACVGILIGLLDRARSGGTQVSASYDELDQGWDAAQRNAWYEAPQGSRLIPYSWLMALEQPSAPGLFLDPAHLSQFRYLPWKNRKGDDVAIGFATDKSDDSGLHRTKLRWKVGQGNSEPWIGLTCSACHTSELTYRGTRLRVEGGPTLGDFQSLIETLNASLKETLRDNDKWDRFAAKVLGGKNKGADGVLLKTAVSQLIELQQQEATANDAELRYGYGRVDAFGHIFNKVAILVGNGGIKSNPSDAPVSIPFIWRAPQLDRVQYNGIAPKYLVLNDTFDVGALARNTGEGIGVFGDVVTKSNPSLSGFSSSVNVKNLNALESQLATLRPPKWPVSVFGDFDPQLVSAGQTLYREKCVGCHALVPRTNLKDRVTVQMSLFDGSSKSELTGTKIPPPGTDPWMACNAFDYSSSSGVLTGMPSDYFKGNPIAETQHVSDLLGVTVAGVLLGQKWQVTEGAAFAFFRITRPPSFESDISIAQNARRSNLKQAELKRCLTSSSSILGYTSRPLNGIWASPPFLHNGSVPTLYDLLLPAGERPKSFYLGTREFDPNKVGFLTTNDAPGNTFRFETRDVDGNEIDGNSNAGHDYSNDQLTEPQRRAIVEYLKTL